jgi:hypothetical protein
MNEQLFDDFVREKTYLKNVSPLTVRFYRDCKAAWDRTIGGLPTEENLKLFVIKLRESGISPATVNKYVRGFNSYLTWLHENHKIFEQLRIKQIKEPQRVIKTFSDLQLKALLSWKPHTFLNTGYLH